MVACGGRITFQFPILDEAFHHNVGRSVVTHRGQPAAWCAGFRGKYRELVLEGNQGMLKSCFWLTCMKRAL